MFSDIFDNKVTAGIFLAGAALFLAGGVKAGLDIHKANKAIADEAEDVDEVVDPVAEAAAVGA